MEILLISILFLVAWLGGHTLDFVFNSIEKIFKPAEELSTPAREPVSASVAVITPTSVGPVVRQARIYLVPSATRH